MARKSGVSITRDNLAKVAKGIKTLADTRVLVGVPAEKADNRTGPGKINNAALAYIHDNGAPEVGIPARPFMGPGIKAVNSQIQSSLRVAAAAAADGNLAKLDAAFNAAGMVARDSIKKTITSNIPPPLAPSTVAGRYRQRGTKTRRKAEKDYLAQVAKGVPPGQAQQDAGIVALVNTGSLLNSISYVLRRAKK